uniref:Death domain-containing protein n=1 Tax=Amphimedon queenslandica TaxID=400682 RepID=A0A1X7SXD7_AMPQE
MQILTAFVMVAEIKSEKSILIDDTPLEPGVYYYLPSAKSGENYTPSENDDKCAFLEVASVNFPANFQACVSQGLMNKNDDVFLCPIEYSNISQFEFKFKGSASGVRINLIYEGQKSRLVIRHDINASTFESVVDACTKVLYAFCHCLGRKANTIRDLRHEVTIPCGLEDKRHTLYFNKELEKCTCLEAIDQNSFRSCWVEAAKKCKELKHSADKIDGKSDRTGPKSIFEIGELFEKFDIDVSRLAEALKIKAPPDFNDKKKAVVFMLLTWEKDGKYDASLLENALKQIGMP